MFSPDVGYVSGLRKLSFQKDDSVISDDFQRREFLFFEVVQHATAERIGEREVYDKLNRASYFRLLRQKERKRERERERERV